MKKTYLLAAIMLFALVSVWVTPAAVRADACADLARQFQNYNAAELAEQFPKYCSEGKLYEKVVGVLYGIIGIFAVLILIYGGYVYMLSRGNAAQAAKGRQILTWAIIGFVVVILAAALVGIVVRFLQQ